MRRFCVRFRRALRARRGFTLIELMIVVAIIGILASIGIALYANMQGRARVARAQMDVRVIASAVSIFATHMDALPAALTDLTTAQVNSLGQWAGPFLANVPSPPASWSAYAYSASTAGTFSISTSSVSDATTVSYP